MLPALRFFFAVEDVVEVVVLLVLVVLVDDEDDELEDAVAMTIETVDPLARLVPPGGACVTTVPTFAGVVTGR